MPISLISCYCCEDSLIMIAFMRTITYILKCVFSRVLSPWITLLNLFYTLVLIGSGFAPPFKNVRFKKQNGLHGPINTKTNQFWLNLIWMIIYITLSSSFPLNSIAIFRVHEPYGKFELVYGYFLG